MRVARLLLSFVLTALFLIPSAAQQTQPPPANKKDPQATEAAQRALTAQESSTAPIQDSETHGTLSYPSNANAFPVRIYTRGTASLRVEVSHPDGSFVRILNGGRAAIIRPDGTVKSLLANNTLGERAYHNPVLSLLGEINRPQVGAIYAAPVQLGTKSYEKVTLTCVEDEDALQADIIAALTKTTFYIDPQTQLVEVMEYQRAAENDSNSKQKIQVFYSDYRRVDGRLIPFSVKTYVEGKPESFLSVSSVVFNQGLPATSFLVPGAH